MAGAMLIPAAGSAAKAGAVTVGGWIAARRAKKEMSELVGGEEARKRDARIEKKCAKIDAQLDAEKERIRARNEAKLTRNREQREELRAKHGIGGHAKHRTPGIHKSGVLMKRGVLNKAFKSRWFVLKDTELQYFAEQGDSKPKGSIELADVRTLLRQMEDDEWQLELETDGRVFVLRGEYPNPRSRLEDWKQAIDVRSALSKRRREPGPDFPTKA